jgi:hypothetical protein
LEHEELCLLVVESLVFVAIERVERRGLSIFQRLGRGMVFGTHAARRNVNRYAMGQSVPKVHEVVEPAFECVEIGPEMRRKRVAHLLVVLAEADLPSTDLAGKPTLIHPHPCQIVDAAVGVAERRLNIDLRVVESRLGWYLDRARRHNLKDVVDASRQRLHPASDALVRVLLRLWIGEPVSDVLDKQVIGLRTDSNQSLAQL